MLQDEPSIALPKITVVVKKGLTASLLQYFLESKGHPVRLVHSVGDLSGTPGDSADVDLMLLDISIDSAHRFERLIERAKATTQARIVAICKTSDARHLEQMIRAGYVGMICDDDCSGESLARTIDLVMSGDSSVPSAFFRFKSVEQGSLLDKLNAAENRILPLIISGLMNKEIAAELGSSEIAVKMHVRRLCEKLKARNRTEVATIGMQLLNGQKSS